jgi:tight adherence protein B
MALLMVALAFVVGVGLVAGLYFGVTKLPGLIVQRRLESRLREVSQPTESHDPSASKVKKLFKEQGGGPLPGLDRLMRDNERAHALARWIEQSGTKKTVGSLLLTAVLFAVVVAFAVTLVVRAPWGLPLGGVVGFSLPFLILQSKRTKRLRKFEEEFPEALDLISRALKAGHAFATGLKMVADEMHEPVGPEFRKTFDEQNFGLPLKDSLENLTLRLPIIDVRFFATAVLIQRDTGGNLSEILENLAHVVRERFKILRQVRVYTAHGRMTGYVLLALAPLLCFALFFINPDHMNLLFREHMGQMMLAGAAVMQVIGYIWIKQVVKIEV